MRKKRSSLRIGILILVLTLAMSMVSIAGAAASPYIKVELADASGVKSGAQKLVISVTAPGNITTVNPSISFDNTVVVPIDAETGKELALTAASGSRDKAAPFKSPQSLNILTPVWKAEGGRTTFDVTAADLGGRGVNCSNGVVVLEFYFKLAAGKTTTDLSSGAFSMAKSLTGVDGMAMIGAKDGTIYYYGYTNGSDTLNLEWLVGSSTAINNNGHGKVTVNKDNPSIGERVKVTVTPESGYEVGRVIVKDATGNSLLGNPYFKIIGQNDYSRRWANYFGLAYSRINVTATEITDALDGASEIIDTLDDATHDTLTGANLETISSIIENYEAMEDAEKENLTEEQVTQLEEIRDKIAEINHADDGVSITGAAWNVRVDAAERIASDPAYNNAELFLEDGLEIEVLYDISLTKSGVAYGIPSGQKITVTIEGDFTGQTVDSVRVFHLKSDYTTEYIKPTEVTATSITFKVSSFSLFGVVSGEFASAFPGDINGDGYVNAEDLVLFLSEFGGEPTTYPDADIDGNGTVNAEDLVIFLANFGKQAS